MNLMELDLNLPSSHAGNIFGQFDVFMKKIEKTLRISIVLRGDEVKLIGKERDVKMAQDVIYSLLELSKRGNPITEQNVKGENMAALHIAERRDCTAVLVKRTAADPDLTCRFRNGRGLTDFQQFLCFYNFDKNLRQHLCRDQIIF